MCHNKLGPGMAGMAMQLSDSPLACSSPFLQDNVGDHLVPSTSVEVVCHSHGITNRGIQSSRLSLNSVTGYVYQR